MTCSLSSLLVNLAEVIYKIKSKHGHDNEKRKIRGIQKKDCKSCLEYTNVRWNEKNKIKIKIK